jgi:broad specificity phosphatase PhoE
MSRDFKIIIVRHGERVDYVFGDWTKHCFDSNGTYSRLDLNLPRKLFARPLHHWKHDTSITELGKWQARQVGDALSMSANIGVVCTSPALRCVQTASEIVSELPSQARLMVEPGLLEMGSWWPGLLTEEQILLPATKLFELGFPVDASMSPVTALPRPDETMDEWFVRSRDVMQRLLQRHATTGVGDLLIVAHGGSHDTLTYSLRHPERPHVPNAIAAAGNPGEKINAFMQRLQRGRGPKNAFCGVACLQYQGSHNSVNVLDASRFALTHMQNARFVFNES